MNKKLRKSEGFTIIEVMIVLAIAGLILLIVFLAVPALQRNARNTSIKNDASAVAAAVTEYESNNSGSEPNNAVSITGPSIALSGGTGTISATAKVQGSTVVSFGGTAPTSLTTSQVQVIFGGSCTGTNGASARSTAVWYGIESAGNTNSVGCISD